MFLEKSCLIFFVGLGLTCLSCHPEDNPTDEFCDVDLGSFGLLTSSLAFLPYDSITSVTYENDAGQQIRLFTDMPKRYHVNEHFNNGKFPDWNGTWFCCEAEYKSVGLVNDSLGIRFGLIISTHYPKDNPKKGIFADEFDIHYGHPGIPQVIDIALHQVIDQRTDLTAFSQTIHYDSITILNRTFLNVLSEESPTPRIYYNSTEGIAGFTDSSGILWQFVSMQ